MWATTSPSIYQRITDQIVAAIEAGAGDFTMPWHTDGTDITQPVNAASSKPYRGINVIALWATAQACGYTGARWATYRQWQEMGAQVRKGEKSAPVVFWKIFDRNEEQAEEPAENDRRRFMARGYSVFNAAQVEGYEPPPDVILPLEGYEPPPDVILPPAERIERAEDFFTSLRADIRHGGIRAYFQPSTDHIQMPPFEAFRDAVSYYATLSHETTHWTGVQSRLDRDMSGRFGSEGCAAEELVAELGAAFLCGSLGLASEPRPDHAAYVASWLKVLRSDDRAIFTAAAKAQQAADHLYSLQPMALKTVSKEGPLFSGPYCKVRCIVCSVRVNVLTSPGLLPVRVNSLKQYGEEGSPSYLFRCDHYVYFRVNPFRLAIRACGLDSRAFSETQAIELLH